MYILYHISESDYYGQELTPIVSSRNREKLENIKKSMEKDRDKHQTLVEEYEENRQKKIEEVASTIASFLISNRNAIKCPFRPDGAWKTADGYCFDDFMINKITDEIIEFKSSRVSTKKDLLALLFSNKIQGDVPDVKWPNYNPPDTDYDSGEFEIREIKEI